MAVADSTLKYVMAQLAGQANNYNMEIRDLNFPNLWEFLKVILPTSGKRPRGRAYLGKGKVDPNDPNSKLVAVLAIGIDWAEYFKYFQYTGNIQVPVPKSICGETNVDFGMEEIFVSTYQTLRPLLWQSLQQFLGDLELYICGMGLGAPLAQLAAIDLRPANVGPNGEQPPQKQPYCFAYSAPNVATKKFATYYNGMVIDSQGDVATRTYWAKRKELDVDFFPSKPTSDLYAILGDSVLIDGVTTPSFDVPWLERSNYFYTKQLGGTPLEGPRLQYQIPNPPSGYKLQTAYTFSQLCANAYGVAQDPTAQGLVPSYTLKKTIEANGTPFCAIYDNGLSFVVAFRGTITWQELYQITSNSFQKVSPVIKAATGQSNALVHTGVSDLYNKAKAQDDQYFKDALRLYLQDNLSDRKLYLTGHDIGGSLANLAAIDYALNASYNLQVEQVYTFGTMGLGDSSFQEIFNENIGSKCFQTQRIYDQLSKAFYGLPNDYYLLGEGVALSGQLTEEENTFHALNTYIQLLNPSAVDDRYLEDVVIHKRLRLSSFSGRPTTFHFNTIKASAGSELHLHSDAPLFLHARSIQVEGEGDLVLRIVGLDGADGAAGANGADNPNGNGMDGLSGQNGYNGQDINSVNFNTGKIEGNLLIYVGGGKGGNGGKGGDGGSGTNGGSGGAGGTGGNGGNGNIVTIYYESISGYWKIYNTDNSGGIGGVGGKGGLGTRVSGPHGAHGTNGSSGTPSEVYLVKTSD